ncbi:MAG: PEGA domain-containing protein [Planctomycetia bacterium]
MRSLLLPLACALPMGSCATFDSSAKVVLSSDPPGARVAIDDEDTGFVTPCILELDPEESAVLSFELPGHEPALRLLVPETSKRAVLWRQMYINSSTWHFPLWLNFRDFVVPVRVDKRLSPARIFVRLERTADQ